MTKNRMEDVLTTTVVDKEKLQQLIKNFYRVCMFCDELDIYEHQELDNSMQEMKDWVNDNFKRE
jgi:hypothetical protein